MDNNLEVNTLISGISQNLLKLSSTLLFFVAVLLMSIIVDCHQVILSIFERRKKISNDDKMLKLSLSKESAPQKFKKSSKSKTSKLKSASKKSSTKGVVPKLPSLKAPISSKASKSVESKSSATKKSDKSKKPAFSMKSIKGKSNAPPQKSDVNGREDRHPPSSTRASGSAFVMVG